MRCCGSALSGSYHKLQPGRQACLTRCRQLLQDDLRPLSCTGSNSQGGIALTLVDALDTLLLMGEPHALRLATRWLARNLRLDVDKRVHVFELTIRAMGGRLAHA